MDITIGAFTFRSEKMDPFKQFHVLRRMGPLFPSLMGFIQADDKLLSLGYAAAALARLSDTDANFVLNSCLATCAIKQGAMWASLTDPNGNLMFKELQLPDIMELVWYILKDNFGPFMPGLLARVSAEEVPKSTS